jgi:hypothetical protein
LSHCKAQPNKTFLRKRKTDVTLRAIKFSQKHRDTAQRIHVENNEFSGSCVVQHFNGTLHNIEENEGDSDTLEGNKEVFQLKPELIPRLGFSKSFQGL